MPIRNRVKIYTPDTYYHIYSRGIEKQDIFKEDSDYRHFLHLLKRYLSGEELKDKHRHQYQDLSKDVELLAYCLMPNHFHLFIFQKHEDGMTKLLRRVVTAYSMYFNKKYSRIGNLFHDRYKASSISNEVYLLHISRYIHLNPLDVGVEVGDYKYSSYPYYTGVKQSNWLKPQRILKLHKNSGQSYSSFVSDYKNHKLILNDIKHELADTTKLD